MDTPIAYEELVKRAGLPPDGQAATVDVNLIDVAVDERARPRLVVDDGRVRLVATLEASGLDVSNPFPAPTATSLSRRLAREHLDVRDLEGHRPGGVETAFLPTRPRPHTADGR